MPTSRPRVTLSDADLHHVVIDVIADEGVDAVTIPRLAAVGKFSAAAAYRRYDNGIDAILEVWTLYLFAHFKRLARATVAWGGTPGVGDAEWLRDELIEPTAETRAVINVMTASRRLPYIGDDIRAGIDDELTAVTALDSRRPPVMTFALLLPVFGAALLTSMTRDIPRAVVQQFDHFANKYGEPAHWSIDSTNFRYVPPEPLVIDTGNPALDDLRNAALRTIIRYGYEGSTATRLSREAGRSLTSAYRRVGNKDTLMLSAITAALERDLGLSGNEAAAAMSFARPDRLQRALQVTYNEIDERNRLNRALILELLLTARVHPDVRSHLTTWFASIVDRYRHFAEMIRPDMVDEITERCEYRVAAGAGAMLLSLVVPRFVSRFDPAPVLSAVDAAVFDDLGL